MGNKSLIKNSIWNLLRVASTTLFPLLTFSYASRKLCADGMGMVSFAGSFVAYYSFLAMLGITNYATRELAKIRENRNASNKFIHEIMIINIISMIVAYILLFVCMHYIPTLKLYYKLLLINSFSIFLGVLGIEWLYIALEDYKFIAIRTIAMQIIAFLLMLVFVKDRGDVEKYAMIQVASSGGANIVNFVHARKYIICSWKHEYQFVKHLKPVFIIFFINFFSQIFTHLDTTMLGFMKSDEAVGLYTAAFRMIRVICTVVAAIPVVLMPRIANYVMKEEHEKIYDLARKAINIILMLSIPACIGVFLLSREIILLFSGDSFENAIVTTKILSFRIILSPLNSFVTLNLFIPIGKDKCNLLSNGCAALADFVLNLIFIPIWAQNAAAVSTILAEVIELVINLYFLNKIYGLKFFENTVQYIIGSISIITLWLILSCIFNNEYLIMVLLILMSIPAYFGILYLLKNDFFMELFYLASGRFRKGL